VKNVLHDVTFNVTRGDKVAIIGYNGLGKTTLMRLIAGTRQPTAGKAILGHNVVTGYLSQEFAETIPPDVSVYKVAKAAWQGGSSLSNEKNFPVKFSLPNDGAWHRYEAELKPDFDLGVTELVGVHLKSLVEASGDDEPIVEGGEGALYDPWGTEYKYEKKGKRFVVISAGPDGEFGGDDDIRSDVTKRSTGND
jgi:energy-coupling factor transporter ATP-binding protein EcfA2